MKAILEAKVRAHGDRLLAMFPNARERNPIALCRKLRRIEAKLHRHEERMCSEEAYCNAVPLSDDGTDSREEVILAQARKLLGSDRVWANGDPRGYALKVDLAAGEVLERDWGGYGLIAPKFEATP